MTMPWCGLVVARWRKVVPVASQQHATTLAGKLNDGFVGRIAGKGFTQKRDLVAELQEQVAQILRHVVV
jgi:hypothetical protein